MSISQLRITFFIAGLAVGGAQQQLVYLTTGLKRVGAAPEIVMAWDEIYAPYAEALTSANVPLLSLGTRRRNIGPRIFPALNAALQRSKPHVLQSFLFYENILTRLGRYYYRVPVHISSVRNIYEGRRWRTLFYRMTDPFTDITTQNSQAGAERYIQVKAVPARKMRVIPNIIDTEKFAPNHALRQQMRHELGIDSQFVWLSAGRLEPAKDPGQLVTAFANVCKVRPDTILLIAGDGTLRSELEQQVHRSGIHTQVRFLGSRTDLPAVMNTADAFVMTSAWEGTPNAVLEASTTALPVVATDVGGTRDAVQDSISGFVVPYSGAEIVTAHMLKIMDMPDIQRQQMGLAGRAHTIAHFSSNIIIEQWKTLYLELLARRGIML